MENRSNDSHAYRAGVKIGAGGVTVGGSIFKRSDQADDNKDTTTSNDANAYDLGISYAMGAYTFGLATAVGRADVAPGVEDKERKWSLGMSTPIDTGVTATLTYIKADYDDGNSGAVTSANDGHALIGQIKVSF